MGEAQASMQEYDRREAAKAAKKKPKTKILTEPARQVLATDFARFDKDGDGFLDHAEVEQMLLFQLEKPLPDDQLKKYFAVLDTDLDGKVSLAEYIKSIGWITNKEGVMGAVAPDGRALGDASAELKNDKEVVMVAVTSDGYALQFASDKLKADKEVVMVAVASHGWWLTCAGDKLKADKEVVMAAVDSDGRALKFASDKLKADKEVVMVAVTSNGEALDYASAELKNDKEVVMVAVTSKGKALEFA